MKEALSISTEVFRWLILSIEGAKCCVCESKADYSPYIEPGQKYIDHITEPGNINLALLDDGTVVDMSEYGSFEKALKLKQAVTMIFSLPRNSFGFDAVCRNLFVISA